MGWKAIRDHYRIEHIVQVTEDGICIGSGYIHDIMVISPEGKVTKCYGHKGITRGDADLNRYQTEMDADPAKLRELVQQADTFEKAITVYSWAGGEITEHQCEETGWPNVTHEGRLMYDNRFSTDRAQVVEWAIRDAEAGVRAFHEHEKTTLQEALKWRGHRIRCQGELEKYRKEAA